MDPRECRTVDPKLSFVGFSWSDFNRVENVGSESSVSLRNTTSVYGVSSLLLYSGWRDTFLVVVELSSGTLPFDTGRTFMLDDVVERGLDRSRD